jgi:hypothetical protein
MTKFNGVLAAGLAIAAMSYFTQPAAAAIEYPWCVSYSDMDGGGGRNCGFVSYDQCMMTARGAGGMCERNLFYPGTTEPPQRVQHKRQRND